MAASIDTIKELAFLCKKYDKVEHFMDIMYVYDKVKPGYLVDFENEGRAALVLFKSEIAPLLQELGLFVSYRHGGYITYDSKLYKQWDSIIGFYFKEKQKGKYFLGYPSCCELAWHNSGNLLIFSIYDTLKRIIVENDTAALNKWRNFIIVRATVPHFPCTVQCPNSAAQVAKFRKVQQKYAPLAPSYSAERSLAAKQVAIDNLKAINHQGVRTIFGKSLPFLVATKSTFHLDNHFFENIEEFIANPDSKLIARMEAYIKNS